MSKEFNTTFTIPEIIDIYDSSNTFLWYAKYKEVAPAAVFIQVNTPFLEEQSQMYPILWILKHRRIKVLSKKPVNRTY